LATQGCNFQQAISPTPVCAPHRASLITGKCQSSTGMVINELRLSAEYECIGHVLGRGGYRTAYLGKWHMWANELGYHDLTRNGFVPPGAYRMGLPGVLGRVQFQSHLLQLPVFQQRHEPPYLQEYEPDRQTDLAIQYMRENTHADQPFALFLSWGPPHDPWDANNVRPDYAKLYRNVTIPRRACRKP
jgi:arylsulfatase A-like enzyme